MAGIEFAWIDERTDLSTFVDRLRWNDLAFGAPGRH
jgi:L-arabinose isomerase